MLMNLIAFFVHVGTSISIPLYLSIYIKEFQYMTNPFLKTEMDPAISNIQTNIDELETCSKLEIPAPCSLQPMTTTKTMSGGASKMTQDITLTVSVQ
jgi:hypothetical protein